MTDYVDGELGEEMRGKVLNHLKACEKCRQFEKVLKLEAVEPFKALKKETPPSFVWERIKERIVSLQGKTSERIVITLKERFSGIFKTLKPAYAISAVVTVILLSVLVLKISFTRPRPLDAYLTEQAEYIINLDQNGASENGFSNESLGTSIETFFLS